MIRNSLNYVAWKDHESVAADLKRIYGSTVDEAKLKLAAFGERWDANFPSIGAMWRRHSPNLIALFDYPMEIRKVIYTSAIESLNSVIRKSVHKRKLFPSDDSVLATELEARKSGFLSKRPRLAHNFAQPRLLLCAGALHG